MVHGWRERGGLPDLYKARQIIVELVRAEEGSDPTAQAPEADTVTWYRGSPPIGDDMPNVLVRLSTHRLGVYLYVHSATCAEGSYMDWRRSIRNEFPQTAEWTYLTLQATRNLGFLGGLGGD